MAKLASFSHDARQSFGVIEETRVFDLGLRVGERIADLKAAIELGAIDELLKLAATSDADYDIDDITFERPIRYPEKIVCVDARENNNSHRATSAPYTPTQPGISLRTPESLVGHFNPIMRPPESDQLSYQAGIAVIIGTAGRRISATQAASYIAGITAFNEGTVCDWLNHSLSEAPGRNFDKSGAIGPWITPAAVIESELDGYSNIGVTSMMNGESLYESSTANLPHSIGKLISYVSSFTGLKPGDIIATGIPDHLPQDTSTFLKPGDRIDITVDGVGTLTNTVVDE